MKTTLCLLLSLFVCLYATAQTPDFKNYRKPIGPKTYKIGDTLPEMVLSNFYFSDKKSPKLSDYKGKWIIFDFWNYQCTSCFTEMPKMDSLNRIYQDRLVIIPTISALKIDATEIDSVQRFWKRHPLLGKTKLPVYLDTVFLKSIVFQGVPFEMWVDPDRVIRGYTLAEKVTRREIEYVLAGQRPDWEDHSGPRRYYDNRPLNPGFYAHAPNGMSAIMLGYLPGLSNKSSGIDSSGEQNRLYIINEPVNTLYLRALQLFPDSPSAYITVRNLQYDVKRYETSFRGKLKDGYYSEDFARANLFSYELLYPKNYNPAEIRNKIIKDFNQFFHLEGRFENQIQDCYILELSGAAAGSRQAYGPTLKQISSRISGYTQKQVFCDPAYETMRFEIPEKMGLKQSGEFDAELAKKELAAIGIRLSEIKMPVPVLVVKE